MPRVSVIVPNYNHAPYLKQRIDSILNQTYQDFELILLDDCSTDSSQEMLLSYKNHPKIAKVIFNNKNSGNTFEQWNKGVEFAKGEYIWIAESDDWAELSFLETILSELEQRPHVGLAYVASKLIDEHGDIIYDNIQNKSEIIEYRGRIFINEKLTNSNAIWNASMMVFKKSTYPSVENQYLFLNMRYCGDWFFYVLVAEQSDVLELKLLLNNFRVHKKNVSSNAETNGLTFLEGLDIFRYLKKSLRFSGRISSSMAWGKSYFKNKKKYQFTKETNQIIIRKMFDNHKLVLFYYFVFQLYYSLKSKS